MTEDSRPQSTDAQRCDALTVMFDGSCPLCLREVSVYRGLEPLQPLRWMDISAATSPVTDAEMKSRFMSRFHVQRADG